MGLELVGTRQANGPETGFVFGFSEIVTGLACRVFGLVSGKRGGSELLQVRLELNLVTGLDRERLDLGRWINGGRSRLLALRLLTRHTGNGLRWSISYQVKERVGCIGQARTTSRV